MMITRSFLFKTRSMIIVADNNMPIAVIKNRQKKTPAMPSHRMFFPVVYKILSSPKKTPGRGAAL